MGPRGRVVDGDACGLNGHVVMAPALLFRSRWFVAAWQERPAAPSLFETVVARCMARDLRAAKLSRSTRVLSSPTPSAAGAWPRSATGFDVMLGLAQGEAKYGDLEKRLAYSRAITVRTITNGGRRQWLAAPGTHPYAKMFLGKLEHRILR
jgi:hypothetical protein